MPRSGAGAFPPLQPPARTMAVVGEAGQRRRSLPPRHASRGRARAHGGPCECPSALARIRVEMSADRGARRVPGQGTGQNLRRQGYADPAGHTSSPRPPHRTCGCGQPDDPDIPMATRSGHWLGAVARHRRGARKASERRIHFPGRTAEPRRTVGPGASLASSLPKVVRLLAGMVNPSCTRHCRYRSQRRRWWRCPLVGDRAGPSSQVRLGRGEMPTSSSAATGCA